MYLFSASEIWDNILEITKEYSLLFTFFTFIILILNSFTPITDWVKRQFINIFKKMRIIYQKKIFDIKIKNKNMPKIYILNIDEVSSHWINNPRNVRQSIVNVLDRIKYDNNKVCQIENLEDWKVLVNNPPDNIIIINCHGEVLPIPQEHMENWQRFYHSLGNNIHNNKWIFVSLTGYSLFSYACDMRIIETKGNNGYMGENGLNEILSIIHGSINCREASDIIISKHGNRALRNINTNITPILKADRSAKSIIKPYRVFYYGKINEGVIALKIGNGYFIHNGISYTNLGFYDQPRDITDSILAEMGIAYALDIVCF